MKKRTAVEILFDDINFGFDLWFESKITPKEFFDGLIDAYETALEIEKEQKRKMYLKGIKQGKKSLSKNTNDEKI